jgi:hypothetical protein
MRTRAPPGSLLRPAELPTAPAPVPRRAIPPCAASPTRRPWFTSVPGFGSIVLGLFGRWPLLLEQGGLPEKRDSD